MWGTCISVWLSWCRRRAVDGRRLVRLALVLALCWKHSDVEVVVRGLRRGVVARLALAANFVIRKLHEVGDEPGNSSSSSRRSPNALRSSTQPDESVRLSQYPLSTVLACRLFSQNNGGPTGHAPPLPRAAPGRPLQGRTSWPTPWTVQQAACGSLARATSAVGRALR